MQFKIKKELSGGRYFVRLELQEWTDNDENKAITFGVPTILIKLENGKETQCRVNMVSRYVPYGFYTQEEADHYTENLKLKIVELKKKWETLKDSWSNEEII